ncbi:TPA: MucBP domain-containing protein [Enterococcus faecalis]
MEKRTDYRRKMALRARKQRYAKVMVLSSFGIVGASLVGTTQAHAEEWVANTPESIQIEQGATSYTLKSGDTLWAISVKINLNVTPLAEANNIDLASGQQYSLQVGTVISWTDKVVTATDANGTVIGQAPITESSKIVKDKSVGENVQQDVVNGNATDKDVQGGSNQTGGNTSNGGNIDNGGSQGGGQGNNGQTAGNEGNGGSEGGNDGETPIDPINPVDPGKPVDPTDPEKPVGAQPVTINYVDESGNTVSPSTQLTGAIGDWVSMEAPQFDGYQLISESFFGTTISNQNQSHTYTYKKVSGYYVGQVLYQSQNFATIAEAELHMDEIAETWWAYADTNGINVDINAQGGGGAYYVKVVVSEIK